MIAGLEPKELVLLVAVSGVTFGLGIWLGAVLSRGGAATTNGGTAGAARGEGRRKSASRTGDEVELYVGNLPYDTSESDLERIFSEFGAVASIRVIGNRMSGKSKGFGFVEMADQQGATAAAQAMNGRELKGRKLVVNEAKSRNRGR